MTGRYLKFRDFGVPCWNLTLVQAYPVLLLDPPSRAAQGNLIALWIVAATPRRLLNGQVGHAIARTAWFGCHSESSDKCPMEFYPQHHQPFYALSRCSG